MKIGCWEAYEVSFMQPTAKKKPGSTGHVRAPILPHRADRTQNFLNVVQKIDFFDPQSD